MIAKPRLKGSSHCGNISKRLPLRGPVAQGIEQRFPGPCVAGSNPARPALTSSRPPFPLVTPDFERDLLDLASAVGFLLGMDQGATSEREVRENVARIIESFDF
jgi:hypothetical protein